MLLAWASHRGGFFHFGSPALEHSSVVVAQRLGGSAHVGPSWTRDQTCVPFTGRQILYHWTTRETPENFLTCDPEENNGTFLTIYGRLDCAV